MTFFRNPSTEQDPYRGVAREREWMYPALFEIHAYAKTSVNPTISRAVNFAGAIREHSYWTLNGFSTASVYAPDGTLLVRTEPDELVECEGGCGRTNAVKAKHPHLGSLCEFCQEAGSYDDSLQPRY